MIPVDCVATSYMQGVGGRKSGKVIIWAWYIVSLRWLFTEPRIDRQIGS